MSLSLSHIEVSTQLAGISEESDEENIWAQE